MEVAPELTPYIDDINALHAILSKFPPPKGSTPPNEPAAEEQVYVDELLAAYAEALNLDELPRESIKDFPKYARDFRQRRNEYYSADAIRNETRDVFPDGSNEFEILKKETYSGIYDVHCRHFLNGFERLLNVMDKASDLQINKSLLGKMPHWISFNEKKGVCHILVNDGEIKWVADNE